MRESFWTWDFETLGLLDFETVKLWQSGFAFMAFWVSGVWDSRTRVCCLLGVVLCAVFVFVALAVELRVI